MQNICSKLTMKTPERRQWHRFEVFIVNFQHILYLFLMLLLVNLNKVSCGFGHIYWRNPKWKTSFFYELLSIVNVSSFQFVWQAFTNYACGVNRQLINRKRLKYILIVQINIFYFFSFLIFSTFYYFSNIL